MMVSNKQTDLLLTSELFFNDVLDNIALYYVIKQEYMQAQQDNDMNSDSDSQLSKFSAEQSSSGESSDNNKKKKSDRSDSSSSSDGGVDAPAAQIKAKRTKMSTVELN